MKLEKCFMCGAPAPSVMYDQEEKTWGVECLACDSLWHIENWGSSPTLKFMADAKKKFYENVKSMAPSEFYQTLTVPPLLQSEIWALKSFERCFYTDRPEILNVLIYFYIKKYGPSLNRPMLDKILADWKRYDFACADDAFAYVKKVFALKKIDFTFANYSL